MYALLPGREACASRLFAVRLKRAATALMNDAQLVIAVYVAHFIVWRALRRGGEKRAA